MSETNAPDRRLRRSDDPLVALHYQLSETRRRGGIAAIVVADTSGLVVAGAGSWPLCEELAAFAPLLQEGTVDALPSRGGDLAEAVAVRTVQAGGQDVLLCYRGGQIPPELLGAAANGIARILAA